MEKKTGKINKNYKKFLSESIDKNAEDVDGMPAFINTDSDSNSNKAMEDRLRFLVDMALPLMKEIESLYPKAKRYKKANECQRNITIAWTKCFKKKEKTEPKPVAKPEQKSKDPNGPWHKPGNWSIDDKDGTLTIKNGTGPGKQNQKSVEKIKVNGVYTYVPDINCFPYMWNLHHGKQVTVIKIDHVSYKHHNLCDSPNTDKCDYLIRVPNTSLGLITGYFNMWTKSTCLKPPKQQTSFFGGWF
jgi:hypothetical protein